MPEIPDLFLSALRVLSDLNAYVTTDPKHVEALRKAMPNAQNLQLDDLACEVIRTTLNQRRETMAEQDKDKEKKKGTCAGG